MTDNNPNQPGERLPQWGEAVVPPFGDTAAMYDIGLNRQDALWDGVGIIPLRMSDRWAAYQLRQEQLREMEATTSDDREREAIAGKIQTLVTNERTQIIDLATRLQAVSTELLALYGNVGAPSVVASLNEIFDHPENGMFSDSHIAGIAKQARNYNDGTLAGNNIRSLLFGAFILRARAAIEASIQAGMSLEEAQRLTKQYVYAFDLEGERYIGIEISLYNAYDAL